MKTNSVRHRLPSYLPADRLVPILGPLEAFQGSGSATGRLYDRIKNNRKRGSNNPLNTRILQFTK